MKKIFVIFFSSLFMIFIVSCKSSTLKGTAGVHYQDVIKTERVTCSKDQLEAYKTVSKSGSNKTKLAVTGQICLNGEVTKIKGNVNVLFIVDTSNSMSNADPRKWLTCEREKAVKKVKSAMGSTSNVQGAIITFSSSASSGSWRNMSSLSTAGVCGASGGTNYEAAFKAAKSMLSGKDGVNIVYFITDGAPSITNSTGESSGNHWSEGQEEGREAMESLQSSISNLTVNALYLVDPELSSYGSDAPTESDTYDYLVDIVGSSSQVRKAKDASELVKQMSTFDTTPAGSFASVDDLKATVTVNSSSSNLEVKNLKHVSEGVYEYELEEVYLKGKSGSTVDNVFKVVGTGSDGTTSVSKITVQFTQTN